LTILTLLAKDIAVQGARLPAARSTVSERTNPHFQSAFPHAYRPLAALGLHSLQLTIHPFRAGATFMVLMGFLFHPGGHLTSSSTTPSKTQAEQTWSDVTNSIFNQPPLPQLQHRRIVLPLCPLTHLVYRAFGLRRTLRTRERTRSGCQLQIRGIQSGSRSNSAKQRSSQMWRSNSQVAVRDSAPFSKAATITWTGMIWLTSLTRMNAQWLRATSVCVNMPSLRHKRISSTDITAMHRVRTCFWTTLCQHVLKTATRSSHAVFSEISSKDPRKQKSTLANFNETFAILI